jgi:hydroxyacylglutathione hydrolase
MLFQRVESEGLAHYSYIVGNHNEAFVIDPRRDVDAYLETASRSGYRIRYVLETHRHEDFVTGSLELAVQAEAELWHADTQWDYRFGQGVRDGQTWEVGGLRLQAIHAPGHTPGLMCYLLYDPEGVPWILFSGDALFAGDVGRMDLMGRERLPEMAGLMYDTLFNRILQLDDGTIVCPAHGFGSICGASIADRSWTTIGLERKYNSRLRYTDRSAFIAAAQLLERPPYFNRMESLNIEGPPLLGTLPVPVPLTPDDFAVRRDHGFLLDTRMELGFGAAHIPGALSIWLKGLPGFAGWFVSYDRPILMVNERDDDAERAVRYLIRLGYDNIEARLAGDMLAWHKSGRESQTVAMVKVQDLCRRLDAEEHIRILDVRSQEELDEGGRIPGAYHIPITDILDRIDEIPKDKSVYVICSSGLCSMIIISLLRAKGWNNLVEVLGGVAGWRSKAYPLFEK